MVKDLLLSTARTTNPKLGRPCLAREGVVPLEDGAVARVREGHTRIQLWSVFRGALLAPGFRRAIRECAIHFVSAHEIVLNRSL
jgi:hypothetical protein